MPLSVVFYGWRKGPASDVPHGGTCDAVCFLNARLAQHGPAATHPAQHEPQRVNPLVGLPPEGHGGDPQLAASVREERRQRGGGLQRRQHHLQLLDNERRQLVEQHFGQQRHHREGLSPAQAERAAAAQHGIFWGACCLILRFVKEARDFSTFFLYFFFWVLIIIELKLITYQ